MPLHNLRYRKYSCERGFTSTNLVFGSTNYRQIETKHSPMVCNSLTNRNKAIAREIWLLEKWKQSNRLWVSITWQIEAKRSPTSYDCLTDRIKAIAQELRLLDQWKQSDRPRVTMVWQMETRQSTTSRDCLTNGNKATDHESRLVDQSNWSNRPWVTFAWPIDSKQSPMSYDGWPITTRQSPKSHDCLTNGDNAIAHEARLLHQWKQSNCEWFTIAWSIETKQHPWVTIAWSIGVKQLLMSHDCLTNRNNAS